MEYSFGKQVRQYLSNHKKNRRLFSMVGLLAVFTAVGVYGAMMRPAISMESAKPVLTADPVEAIFGDELTVTVEAAVPADADSSVYYYISAEQVNAELSDITFDGDGAAQVAANVSYGIAQTLILHRDVDADGATAGYWFTQDADQSVDFMLSFSAVGTEQSAEQSVALTEEPESEPSAPPETDAVLTDESVSDTEPEPVMTTVTYTEYVVTYPDAMETIDASGEIVTDYGEPVTIEVPVETQVPVEPEQAISNEDPIADEPPTTPIPASTSDDADDEAAGSACIIYENASVRLCAASGETLADAKNAAESGNCLETDRTALLLTWASVLTGRTPAAEEAPAEDILLEEDSAASPSVDGSIPDGCYQITLHDMGTDGVEIPDDSIDFLLEAGTSARASLLSSTLTDGTRAADCLWYTLDADGNKSAEPYDPDAADTAAGDVIHLYTYSYSLTLTSGDTTVLTDTRRQHEAFTASDFVVDSIDYSLCTWTTDSGNALVLSDMIGAGLTENLSAATSDTTGATDVTVNYYVCLDGTWTNVGSTTAAYGPETAFDGRSRYYVTVGQIESVLGTFGFDASTYNGGLFFPHKAPSESTVWTDAHAKALNGTYCVPVGAGTGPWDIYYSPANASGAVSYFTGSKGVSDTDYVSDNSIYSLTVTDAAKLVYTKSTLPAARYAFTGNTVTVTVKAPEDVLWICTGTDKTAVSGVEGADADGNRTMSFTIESIAQAYTVSAYRELGSNSYAVNYIVSGTLEQAGQNYNSASQRWYETAPTVNGVASLSDFLTADSGGYTVRAPDRTTWISRANYGSKGDQLFTYTFRGWQISYTDGNGDAQSITVQAGDVLTDEQLALYADDYSYITLTSIWRVQYGADNSAASSVGFYVNVSSTIENTTDNTGGIGTAKFSDCLYTTSVSGGSLFAQYILNSGTLSTDSLIVGNNSLTALEIDQLLRTLDTTGYTSDTYGFVSIGSFPSDEEIFARLRTWADRYSSASITLDGVEIDTDALNSDYFTIRWYVFKYDETDNWHIDGILVPRVGKLTVKKTFLGDEDAIAAVKSGDYGITLTPSNTSADTLTLSLDSADEYNEETNTYTWVVDVWQNTNYTAVESNYISTNSDITTTAEYLISNSADATTRWQTYPTTGVTVTGYVYPLDLGANGFQTLSIRNTYTPPYTLVFHKEDSESRQGIANVSFLLSDSDGATVSPIYSSLTSSSCYYLYLPEDMTVGTDVEIITDGIITGSNGEFYLGFPSHGSGEYLLTETVPTGYGITSSTAIHLHLANGILTVIEADGVAFDAETRALTLDNVPETTSVTAKKIWTDGTDESVTVVLRANGAALSGAAYTQTLNAKNGWTYTWDDLPLYANGSPVTYSLYEKFIGASAYDSTADPKDGFVGYIVTMDAPVYRISDGSGSYINKSGAAWLNDSNVYEYATNVLLTVRNTADIGQIPLDIQKTDSDGNALSGAVFELYELSEDNEWELVFINDADAFPVDENGLLHFSALAPGDYRLIELTAPDGYHKLSEDIEFTISYNGIVSLSQTSDYWILTAPETEDAVYTITVKNDSGFALPKTGGTGTLLFTTGGLALMLFGGLMFIHTKRRKSHPPA